MNTSKEEALRKLTESVTELTEEATALNLTLLCFSSAALTEGQILDLRRSLVVIEVAAESAKYHGRRFVKCNEAENAH